MTGYLTVDVYNLVCHSCWESVVGIMVGLELFVARSCCFGGVGKETGGGTVNLQLQFAGERVDGGWSITAVAIGVRWLGRAEERRSGD